LALEKVCPTCGSDNSANAINCYNCGFNIARFKATPRPRERDKSGEKPATNQHEVILNNTPVNKIFVPGPTIASQSVGVNKLIKPIEPQKKLISDDEAEVVDDVHLSDIEHSAEHLGL
jgi:ribosomal protein L40E